MVNISFKTKLQELNLFDQVTLTDYNTIFESQ